MKKFIIPLVTAAVVVSILFVGCVPAAEPPVTPPTPTPPLPATPPVTPPGEPVVEEWVIPLISPLSGGFASYGQEALWASQLAAEDINAAGGIAGRPLKLIIYDSASDPARAHVATAKALGAKPIIVLLNDCADQGRASMDLIVEEEVFALMPATGVLLNREYAPWATIFMNYEENFFGPFDIEVCKREGFHTVVSLYDNTIEDFIAHEAGRCKNVAEGGIEIVGEVTFEQFTMVDYSPVAVKALALEADAYMFTCQGFPVAKIVKEMYKIGMTETRRFLIGLPSDYPELYLEGGDFIEGAYVESFYDLNHPGEKWQSIKARWEAYTDTPMGFGVLMGYSIVDYLKSAIEETGVTGDPAKLAEEREMLANWCYNQEDYPFLMGNFDIINGVAAWDIYMNQIVNNQKSLIKAVPSGKVPPAIYAGPEYWRPKFEP
ncbi:hypothetical protein ES703_16191 [subsurface metagenome]